MAKYELKRNSDGLLLDSANDTRKWLSSDAEAMRMHKYNDYGYASLYYKGRLLTDSTDLGWAAEAYYHLRGGMSTSTMKLLAREWLEDFHKELSRARTGAS